MPLIERSSYISPWWLQNGHAATIYPSMFRRTSPLPFRRERLELPDGDFVDFDYLIAEDPEARRLVTLSHGLEGSSANGYIQGMAGAFWQRGWSVLAWNYRSCSGVPNRLLRMYHSGATEDLDLVLAHGMRDLAPRGGWRETALVGFSLGGNLTLKYMAERGRDLPRQLSGAVAFSAPCDLKSSSEALAAPANRVYMRQFLKELETKLAEKAERFPGLIDLQDFKRIRTFPEFDSRFTAPFHGFRDAEDYYRQASSRPLLARIRRPTLLVNARNDPFLGPGCYPEEEARASKHFFLETPMHGGHVGFARIASDGCYWSELRAVDFIDARRREYARL
ncbi:MAG: alpha/beta hydrolase [Leptospirales bacterium]|nr:alpha/beta hydrolase [Leptospirales bacterium]